MSPEKVIEAAGGVLWRPAAGGSGIEVALVHRPKYDDWSIPKGKLNAGEHPVLGAIREVQEETGHVGAPGRPLGEIHYLKDGSPKRVRYWAMRVTGGEFVPNDEVDQLMWLPPREAQRHLLPDRDQRVVQGVTQASVSTWPCLIVRHASAGERSSWAGNDRERPLDALGDDQAEALVPLLAAYDIRRVMSADVLRCLETIGPYAAVARLTVESEPLLSEAGYDQQPDLAAERLVELLGTHVASVVCTQRKTIPGLVQATCTALGAKPPEDPSLRKAGLFAVHLQAAPTLRIAAIERFDPVV
ncbi:MAG TPA: NUDIX domain-containing protein [Mycobacteriales bacterium]|nr:NUDIX domain-containing protein [Mycobacteriales bacterium]